jgi:hypothetical protein
MYDRFQEIQHSDDSGSLNKNSLANEPLAHRICSEGFRKLAMRGVVRVEPWERASKGRRRR